MFRNAFIIVCLNFFCLLASASEILLIPQPRSVEILSGEITLSSNAALSIPDASHPDYRNAADLLRRRIGEMTQPDFPLAVAPADSDALQIVLAIAGRDAAAEAINQLGEKKPQTPEGYFLESTSKRILLAGNSGAGLFYAAQTFLQLLYPIDNHSLTLPAVRISDWPESGFRGVMIDSSQGILPNLETVKRFIASMAEFKLNKYYLYSEDTLEYPNQPLIGETNGRYTPDDIRAIVAAGAQNYVEIVPCVQFHGHLHNNLRVEKYSDLAEVPHGGELSPGQQGVDEFVEKCVKTLAELFPSKSIHAGGDETYELGTGRSRERHPNRPAGEIYLEHALKVQKIIRSYGRTPEVWGDILLNHPEIINSIPKNMRMMTWSYFERQDDFTPLVKPFADAGLPFVVCPGVRNWMQIYPNFKGMSQVVDVFLKRGRESGTDGILNTLWIDTCEELHSLNYYGFAYGAAAGWQPQAPDLEAFERGFAWAFHGDATGDVLKVYHEVLESQVIAESLYSGSSIRLFWLDPFEEEIQKRIVQWEPKLRDMRIHAENALERIYESRQKPLRNADLLDFIEYAALRLDLAGLKLQYGPEMSRIYRAARQSNDRSRIQLAGIQLGASTKANKCRVYDFIFLAGNLKSLYRDLWLRGNTPYNLEGTLALWDREIFRGWEMYDKINQAWEEYYKTKALPAPETLGFYVE
ncbi:MAG: beta-N-acetylhexosaminidase [Candidatus Omnitrophota bacterium]